MENNEHDYREPWRLGINSYFAGGDRYPLVASAVFNEPWMIQPEMLAIICEVISARVNGVMLDDPSWRASAAAFEARAAAHADRQRDGGSVAVLPLFGIMSQRMNMMTSMSGGTSTESFRRSFQMAVRDDAISSIVLDVDSPGGSVFGVQELWQTVMDARGTKPVIAVANSTMASAAYYISSAADEIVVAPMGEVGSIGVLIAHEDISGAQERAGVKTTLLHAGKNKVLANPFEPLSEEGREMIEAKIGSLYDSFVNAVARGRGVKPSLVRSGFGEGGMVLGPEAVRIGMADRTGTLDQTIARLTGRGSRTRASSRRTAQAVDPNEVGSPFGRRRALL